MTPHKQLLRHDPGNGVHGDCHRTAIACLLDMQPKDVPHFYAYGVTVADGLEHERRWFAERGMRWIHIRFPAAATIDQVLAAIALCNPGLPHLVGGLNPHGVPHSVICRDRAIVHDPSPESDGLAGPMPDGWWWVSFAGADL